MSIPDRQTTVAQLRHAIEKIEQRSLLEPVDHAGLSPVRDAQTLVRLDPYGLHEVWAPAQDGSGAVLSFALGQGRMWVSQRRPVLLFLSLAHQEGETGLPYGPGLSAFDLSAGNVVLVRAQTIGELLWAAEEAACSAALAGVMVESLEVHRALDFTALRRLALRSGVSGTPVLLMRYGTQREASPARTRWLIEAYPALADAYDRSSTGLPRWRVVLEKAPRGERGGWIVSWRGNAFVMEKGDGQEIPLSAPVPGVVLPLLGDRLAQAS